ncbi:MAG: hypothetical protein LVS60_09715 [Nodosilinea sp. LVE1205-7]
MTTWCLPPQANAALVRTAPPYSPLITLVANQGFLTDLALWLPGRVTGPYALAPQQHRQATRG